LHPWLTRRSRDRAVAALWSQTTLGLLSMLSAFMAAGFLLMNNVMLAGMREAFYRETAARTYSGAIMPVALFLVEIQWVALVSLAVCAARVAPASSC
jgi:hypothetical protein